MPKGRRAFLGHSAVAAAGVGLFALGRWQGGILAKAAAGEDGEEKPEIVPPGCRSIQRYRQRCVGCQSCVVACPVDIIRDDPKLGRPVMNYDYGYCHYACMQCAYSCPAHVFGHITLEEKQVIRIAKTSYQENDCVVITRGEACGACAEVCPTHAVRMREREGGLPSLPDFDPQYCVGCGACYHVCPAEPRAFQLTGLAVHETAPGIRPGGVVEETPPPLAPPGEEGELQDFPF